MTDTSPEAVADIVRQLRVPGVGALWGNGDLFPDAADTLESLSAALHAERTAREAAERSAEVISSAWAIEMAKRKAFERHLTEARRVVEAARAAFVEIDACFEAAEFEGLRDAIGECDAERLIDLIGRRIMHARYAAVAALSALDRGPDGDGAA